MEGGWPLTQDEIRAQIRVRLKSGVLPRYLPALRRVDGGTAVTTSFTTSPGAGRACAACDGAQATITHQYQNRDFALHEVSGVGGGPPGVTRFGSVSV